MSTFRERLVPKAEALANTVMIVQLLLRNKHNENSWSNTRDQSFQCTPDSPLNQ